MSFRPEAAFLRVRDLRSGRCSPWHIELATQVSDAEARRRAEQRAARDAEAKRVAEARLAALETTFGTKRQ